MPRKGRSRRRLPASRPGSTQTSPTQKSPAQKSLTQPPAQSAFQRELATKRLGELAELAFTLKATALGFTVSKPYGESNRYDFIVDSSAIGAPRTTDSTEATEPKAAKPIPEPVATKKPISRKPILRKQIANISADQLPHPPSSLWRVQVKCSTQLLNGLYRVNAHRRINGRAVPYLSSEIDFFAAYIIPEDTWYIIPLLATRSRTSLLFRRQRDPRPGLYDACREAWPLLHPRTDKLGLTP